MSFGEKLKQLREEHELNQDSLAKLLNLHRGTISKYETGDLAPNDETKKKIADYFGVSLDWMLGRSSKKYLDKEYAVNEKITKYRLDNERDLLINEIKELNIEEIKDIKLFIAFLKSRRTHD